MRCRPLAVLRTVPAGARRAGSTVVRPMRTPRPGPCAGMPRLSAAADRQGTRTVPVRRTGASRDPSPEILGLAEHRGRARGRDGGRRSTVGGCRDVGAARAPAAGRARLRSGARPGRRRRIRARSPGRSHEPARPEDEPTGSSTRRRAACRHARRVRTGRPRRGAPAHPRGRRPDHRCHGGGMRRRARSRGSTGDIAGHGRARILAGDPSIYSNGLSTGSVVARGTSPVVDASRGRNDPRKATIGRPSMARFRCKSCLGTGNRSGRRS